MQPSIDTFVTDAVLRCQCSNPFSGSGLCQYFLPDLFRDDFSLHAIPLSRVRIVLFLSQTLLALYGVPVTLDALYIAPSLEVTPAADKLARRIETFQATMDTLYITEQDIRSVFSRTQFELGIPEAFRFEDSNSPII